MFLRQLNVSNFKSFEDISVDFGWFNVLVGANASGKSNFVSIFSFLKDIVSKGLENAISCQGGMDYVRNINLRSSQPLSMELIIDSDTEREVFIEREGGGLIGISPHEFSYKFAVDFGRKSYSIAEEIMGIGMEISRLERRNGKMKEGETLEKGKIVIYKKKGKIKYEIDEDIKQYLEKYIFLPLLDRMSKEESRKKLFLERGILLFPLPVDSQLRDFIHTISLYDFYPKYSKQSTQITGPSELEPDGSNLAIVLKTILEDKEKTEKLSDILRSILPFVEKIGVEKLLDKSLITSLKEVYSKEKLPAFLISDGTMNITALIIALYFEMKPFLIFEEPERNIHPYLISRVMEMMRDVSEDMKRRQIIMTTHNPEVVKYADVDHLLFMYRDENGFSRISRPSEKEQVKTFLESDVSLEDLYVRNLLE